MGYCYNTRKSRNILVKCLNNLADRAKYLKSAIVNRTVMLHKNYMYPLQKACKKNKIGKKLKNKI
jgi:hypothetical protein